MDNATSRNMDGARLGAFVRRLREQAGMSLRSLATAAEVDATWLSRLEHGRYSAPHPAGLYRLARALEVEVAELYLAAGFGDARELPGFAPYLRSKYELPDEAVAQLQAHFELINDKYRRDHREQGGDHP